MIEPWVRPGYSDITDVEVAWPFVNVKFANGDEVVLDALQIAAEPDMRGTVDPEDPTGFYLVPDEPKNRRWVAWETVRSAADPAFASYRRDLDRQEARRFGRRLKALREDVGFAQKQLAELAGMSAPQLAKIERGESDVRLSTIRALLRPLDATIADLAGPDVPEVSAKSLVSRIRRLGIDPSVATAISRAVDRSQVADAFARAFGLDLGELRGNVDLTAPRTDLVVQFKAASTSDPRLDPMLAAAERIAEVVVDNTELPPFDPSLDPEELVGRLDVRDAQHALKQLVEWAWAHGVPVISLYGKGGFAAAIWRTRSRPVVFIKDSRSLAVYWLFDLAHEIGHLAAGHLDSEGIVDVSAPRYSSDEEDQQEREATDFALRLLVPNVSELVREVRDRSIADGPTLFKGAVATVAAEAGLDPGLLGVIAAYGLPDVARMNDRWGSANNLAGGREGRAMVETSLRSRLDLERSDPLDAAWIRALTAGG